MSRAAARSSSRIRWARRAGYFARRLHRENPWPTSFRPRRRHHLARTSRDLLPHRPPDRRPKARWHRRSANPDATQLPHANHHHCSERAPQLSPRRLSRRRHRRQRSAADCQDPARAHRRHHHSRRTNPPTRMPGCSGWRSSQHPRPDPAGSDHGCPHSYKPPLVQLIERRRAPDRIRRPASASCRGRAPRPALRRAAQRRNRRSARWRSCIRLLISQGSRQQVLAQDLSYPGGSRGKGANRLPLLAKAPAGRRGEDARRKLGYLRRKWRMLLVLPRTLARRQVGWGCFRQAPAR